MKKKIIASITLLAIAGGLISTLPSCKKEGATPQNSFNLSVVETPSNDRGIGSTTCLAFKTIADYETAVTQPTATTQTALTNLINSFPTFTSYTTTYPNDTLFGDTDFTNLLNGAGVIQIGDYFFKVDPVLHKVFVLPISESAYYYDLVTKNPQTGKVAMFSTEEDVLALIKDGIMGNLVVREIEMQEDGTISSMRGWVRRFVVSVSRTFTDATNSISATIGTNCGEPYAGSGSAAALYPGSLTGGGYAWARYRKFGVYFHLYAFLEYSPQSNITLNFIGGMPYEGYIYYKLKCKNTIASYTLRTSGTYDSFNKSRKYHSYQGSKALTKYYFAYRVQWDYNKAMGLSNLIKISSNM